MAIDDCNGDRQNRVVIDANGAGAGEELGTVVVTVVADQLDADPAALPPLSERIDPDLLDQLDATAGQPRTALSFEYLGYDVVVTSDGIVELRPHP